MFCLNSSLHGIVVEPGLDPFIFAIIFLWEIKDFSMQLKGIFIIYKVSYEIEVFVFGSAVETNANCINIGEDSAAQSN